MRWLRPAMNGLFHGIAKEISLALGGAKSTAGQHAIEVFADDGSGSARLGMAEVFDGRYWTLRHSAKLTGFQRERFALDFNLIQMHSAG